MTHTLYGRIALVFAALTLLCGGFTAWLFMEATNRHQQEVIQKLSRDLAGHIAGHTDLISELKWNRAAVDDLFHMLMVVNPSIEVYLLDKNGHIDAHVAPPGRVQDDTVDLAPIRAFLGGAPAPLSGDDPRDPDQGKIFSVAPLIQDGATVGFLYVVLAGEDYQRTAADVWRSQTFTTASRMMLVMVGLTLLAGLAAFALITRRVRRLIREVKELEQRGFEAREEELQAVPGAEDEIGQLHQAFRQMAGRITSQVRELKRQDQLRREMVANISHDLRTPLTSLQGYLETLSLKSGTLSEADRQRYLDVAVRQSRKVSKLAQELFELAKLECEVIKPHKETFALPDLIQDVLQKFELSAREKQVTFDAAIAANLPPVMADLGMMERVLTNLLDNALRHTPPQGQVCVELSVVGGNVLVRVADNGSGIPAALRAHLFERPSPLRDGFGRTSGGLGLIIVKRILNLHGSAIRLEEQSGQGAAFSFALPIAG